MPESMDQLFAFVESLDRNREAHAALIADLLARPAGFDAAYVVDYAADHGFCFEVADVEAFLQDHGDAERELTDLEFEFVVGGSNAKSSRPERDLERDAKRTIGSGVSGGDL